MAGEVFHRNGNGGHWAEYQSCEPYQEREEADFAGLVLLDCNYRNVHRGADADRGVLYGALEENGVHGTPFFDGIF